MRAISIFLFLLPTKLKKWRVTFARRSVLSIERVGSLASTTQHFAQEKLCLSAEAATICVVVTTRRWLTLNPDTSDRLCRATPTNFVTHTITSQPESCQARNAAPTDTRMTLCASIMSRACGPWPCGVSGTDVGVSASHNKRVSHLACTGHKRSESRCNPCAFSALAPTDMFTCHSEGSALLCNPNTSTQCGILVWISVFRQSKVLFVSLQRRLSIYRYVWTQTEVFVRHGLFPDVCG
jgi:hypothetical protein